MEPEEREKFYDTEIAPALLKLGAQCQKAGISIIVQAEWIPGETSETYVVLDSSSIKTKMTYMAMKSHGNADALIVGLQKYGEEHGTNSVFLHILDRMADTQ